MRYRFAGLSVVALALLFSAAPQAGQASRSAAAQKLPPLSYVCTMAGDEDVVEDKPGDCPKCKMTLVPVRLDAKYWCPVHQGLEVADGPGKCRRDGRELIPVTVALTWTCADAPDKALLEPGTCANGQPRTINYALRAHGDHNPKHGGQFFMAADAWHHLEGTYPQNGLFRAYFYNNFTKPLEAKGFKATLVVRDQADKEVASAPLTVGRDRTTMEARVPAAHAALPLRVTLKLKLSDKVAEQPFDFQFNEYSKEPPPAPAGTPAAPATTTRQSAPATPAPAPPRPAAAPATAQPSPARPAAPAPAQAAQAAQAPPAAPQAPTQPLGQAGSTRGSVTQTPDALVIAPAEGRENDPFAGEIAPMPPALAAALNEEVLPKDLPGLLTELDARTGQIDSLMRDGNLAEVWLPAMGTKTVALVLENHAASLPAQQRAAVTSAVKRVVTSAWEIDGYGDLGNKSKLTEAYQRLSAAVADLKAAYGTR
jgi:hypothetical protein